jgi:hypothetical protein
MLITIQISKCFLLRLSKMSLLQVAGIGWWSCLCVTPVRHYAEEGRRQHFHKDIGIVKWRLTLPDKVPIECKWVEDRD